MRRTTLVKFLEDILEAAGKASEEDLLTPYQMQEFFKVRIHHQGFFPLEIMSYDVLPENAFVGEKRHVQVTQYNKQGQVDTQIIVTGEGEPIAVTIIGPRGSITYTSLYMRDGRTWKSSRWYSENVEYMREWVKSSRSNGYLHVAKDRNNVTVEECGFIPDRGES